MAVPVDGPTARRRGPGLTARMLGASVLVGLFVAASFGLLARRDDTAARARIATRRGKVLVDGIRGRWRC